MYICYSRNGNNKTSVFLNEIPYTFFLNEGMNELFN